MTKFLYLLILGALFAGGGCASLPDKNKLDEEMSLKYEFERFSNMDLKVRLREIGILLGEQEVDPEKPQVPVNAAELNAERERIRKELARRRDFGYPRK